MIYVSSRVYHATMWRNLRDLHGYPINSTWIDKVTVSDYGQLWLDIDEEICKADSLVLFARRDSFPFKGALVEVGIALTRRKPIYVAAPHLVIHGTTDRPLGSWIRHPLVTVDTSETALLDCLKKAKHACDRS